LLVFGCWFLVVGFWLLVFGAALRGTVSPESRRFYQQPKTKTQNRFCFPKPLLLSKQRTRE
jgi:hypothetical protein